MKRQFESFSLKNKTYDAQEVNSFYQTEIHMNTRDIRKVTMCALYTKTFLHS